jgi:hypothetical protein
LNIENAEEEAAADVASREAAAGAAAAALLEAEGGKPTGQAEADRIRNSLKS